MLGQVAFGMLVSSGPRTLARTLLSYREAGLLDRLGQLLVFVQAAPAHPPRLYSGSRDRFSRLRRAEAETANEGLVGKRRRAGTVWQAARKRGAAGKAIWHRHVGRRGQAGRAAET